MFRSEVVDVDHLARLTKIDNVTTPAMSIVINNKLRVFETFQKMNEGTYIEIKREDVVYLPHIIPQYREDVVKNVIKEVLDTVEENKIISLSYYRNPKIYEPLEDKKPKMLLVRNIPSKPSLKGLIEFFLYIRELSKWETVIQVSSYIDWKYIPFLIYLGVDVIDVGTYELKIMKAGSSALVGYGSPFLIGSTINIPKEDKSAIIELNRYVLDELFRKIRKGISKGKLRDLIEIYSHIDQETDAFLAFLDNQYLSTFTKRVSIRKPKTNIFVGLESFNRPIIKWYYERFRERYISPKIPEIIVLFPCAARKPYSYSKSHKLFKEALNQGAGGLSYLIHEVMLTSPIGVVPRELEFSYPNAHYDTTTTGNWSINEIEHTASMLEIFLRKFLEQNEKIDIVVHLEGGYKDAALKALDKLGLSYQITTLEKHPTDPEALNNLSRTISDLLERVKAIDPSKRKRRNFEDVKSILSYQFGPTIANAILDEGKIEGSLYSSKGLMIRDYGVFDKEVGFFIPLKKGAQILIENNKYFVLVEKTDVVSNEFIYASDITDIDPEVDPGEYVVIGDLDKNPLATGIILFSGRDVKKASESKVIKIVRKF